MSRPTAFEPEPAQPPSLFCPDPGMYEDIPFETYCKWDAVNSSRLKLIAKSPLHYQCATGADSKALRLGRLIHCGKLESTQLPWRYAVLPPFHLASDNVDKDGNQSRSKATTAYKNQKAKFLATCEANGREVVTSEEYQEMLDVLLCVDSNPLASLMLNGEGRTELSIIWHDASTGLRCKARIDKENVRHGKTVAMTDLKTDKDPGDFEWSIWNYEYHCQAAWYLGGWKALTGDDIDFRIVAAGKSDPMQARAAAMSQNALAIGQLVNMERLAIVKQCIDSGEWPGYDNPEQWDVPKTKSDWFWQKDDETPFDWSTVR